MCSVVVKGRKPISCVFLSLRVVRGRIRVYGLCTRKFDVCMSQMLQWYSTGGGLCRDCDASAGGLPSRRTKVRERRHHRFTMRSMQATTRTGDDSSSRRVERSPLVN